MREKLRDDDERLGGARERDRCLRVAKRYLQTADAEDAVQEALLRAWQKTDAWISPHGPLPFLLSITRKEALRLWAGGRQRPTPVAEVPEPGEDDPELARIPLRDQVEAALRRLPEDDRLLLESYYWDDLSQKDLASRLGMLEATVKIRLHRARARLRAALEPNDISSR